MTEPTDETAAHNIPGWDRPAWAVRGVKAGPELIWVREANADLSYTDGGVEDTFAPELVRTLVGQARGLGSRRRYTSTWER
jgi:hypothetical protein